MTDIQPPEYRGRDWSSQDDMWPEAPTAEQILTKAIKQAIDGGWKNEEEVQPITIEGSVFLIHRYLNMPHIFFDVRELIFNHDFAKALWGKEYLNLPDVEGLESMAWRYHLQQMVVADDPIQYLGKHL